VFNEAPTKALNHQLFVLFASIRDFTFATAQLNYSLSADAIVDVNFGQIMLIYNLKAKNVFDKNYSKRDFYASWPVCIQIIY